MRNFKKVATLSMATMMMLIALCGCNNGKTSNEGGTIGSKGQITVQVANLGYGISWLNDLAKEFTAETDIGVTIIPELGTGGMTAIDTQLMSGQSSADIIFTKKGDFGRYVYMTQGVDFNGKHYDKLYIDLNDVWAEIGDKVNDQYKDFFNYDDNYYAVPWAGGAFGLVRNRDAWTALGYETDYVPATTDELFEVCDNIVAQYSTKKIYPFTYSYDYEYYSDFVNIYFAQYEGTETFNRFKEGKAPIGYDEEYIYSYQGQYEVVEVLAKLLEMEKTSSGDYKYKYQDEYSTSQDFTDMQGAFLDGVAAFCINGSWLGVEMGSDTANIDFVKAPVISSITDRFAEGSDKTDAKLREIVKYVDGTSATKPTGVTDADIKLVRDARKNSYASGGVDHQAFIPCYSDNIDQAKQFLKFMYSDKGLNTYYDTMGGLKLPATPTGGYAAKENLSVFTQSVTDLLSENYICTTFAKSKMFTLAGVSTIYRNGMRALVETITAQAKKDKTIEEIVTYVMTTNQTDILNKWSTIKNNI
ncbi:MAG: carbohydrate ABC transporter substrate-binding protein [Clostridiales bacterium]|nr:carbohydrate ABC transporter substrate-binding protein [Clostridiales bacterium]